MEVSPGLTSMKGLLDTTRGNLESWVRPDAELGSLGPRVVEIAEQASPLEVSIIGKESQNSTARPESVIASPVPRASFLLGLRRREIL